MDAIWLPDSIRKMVRGRRYTLNDVGMSGSKVYMFEDMVLKVQKHSEETDNEYKICHWLGERLPVPEILRYEAVGGVAYCLMSRVAGRMLCDDRYLKDPALLLKTAAGAMKRLWAVDIADCPCDSSLSVKLKMARCNVENGLVDLDNVEPETFGEAGFASPEALLLWLENNRPDEDLVLSHGDFCLPNLFARGDEVTGFIDLGKMGVADRWQDVAICYRSLKHNFDGKYNGGASYEGYSPEMLFETLGIEENREKLRYYILLDELF